MKGLHTPWSDEITLLRFEGEKNAAGYRNPEPVASCPPLLCSFEDGVSQSEFYLSRKAGMQADAQAEVWAADYDAFWPEGYAGRRQAQLWGRTYEIVRAFQNSMDTKILILQEVLR